MKLEDFNTPTPEIKIGDVALELKKFTLFEKAWAYHSFASSKEPNGLTNLAQGLSSLDAVVIARFAWRLVKNKRDISEEDFFNFAERRANLMVLLEAINKVLTLSQPTVKANERLKELKKS